MFSQPSLPRHAGRLTRGAGLSQPCFDAFNCLLSVANVFLPRPFSAVEQGRGVAVQVAIRFEKRLGLIAGFVPISRSTR